LAASPLATPGFDWDAFIADLHRRTMGMGSLSDIYIRPPAKSGLDKLEANRQLSDLTEKLHLLTRRR